MQSWRRALVVGSLVVSTAGFAADEDKEWWITVGSTAQAIQDYHLAGHGIGGDPGSWQSAGSVISDNHWGCSDVPGVDGIKHFQFTFQAQIIGAGVVSDGYPLPADTYDAYMQEDYNDPDYGTPPQFTPVNPGCANPTEQVNDSFEVIDGTTRYMWGYGQLIQSDGFPPGTAVVILHLWNPDELGPGKARLYRIIRDIWFPEGNQWWPTPPPPAPEDVDLHYDWWQLDPSWTVFQNHGPTRIQSFTR